MNNCVTIMLQAQDSSAVTSTQDRVDGLRIRETTLTGPETGARQAALGPDPTMTILREVSARLIESSAALSSR